jgi:hypothetical protein
MNLSAVWRISSAAACAAALSGCAAAVLYSFEPEQRAAWFLVPADKAVIYFYRDEQSDGTLPLVLSVDGKVVGEARPTKFLFYEVAPGHHTLVSSGAASDSIELDTEPGKTYFVGQQVECDASQLHLHLHEDKPAAGKVRVKELFASGRSAPDGERTAEHTPACATSTQGPAGKQI